MKSLALTSVLIAISLLALTAMSASACPTPPDNLPSGSGYLDTGTSDTGTNIEMLDTLTNVSGPLYLKQMYAGKFNINQGSNNGPKKPDLRVMPSPHPKLIHKNIEVMPSPLPKPRHIKR